MAPAFSIIRARSANGTFRYSENVSAALCSFTSICESLSGSKDLISCPVAGFTVAIAILILPRRNSSHPHYGCNHLSFLFWSNHYTPSRFPRKIAAFPRDFSQSENVLDRFWHAMVQRSNLLAATEAKIWPEKDLERS